MRSVEEMSGKREASKDVKVSPGQRMGKWVEKNDSCPVNSRPGLNCLQIIFRVWFKLAWGLYCLWFSTKDNSFCSATNINQHRTKMLHGNLASLFVIDFGVICFFPWTIKS